jgi:beta-phosphoglucomutase
MKMRIKALIFDMDGVIVDNARFHYKAWRKYAARLGKEVSFDEVKSWFGSTNDIILGKLIDGYISSDEIRFHSEEKEKLYRQLFDKEIRALKGLEKFLKEAQQAGLKIGMATSAPPANVDFVLNHTGLRGYFDTITDDSQIANGKPHPEIFLKTAEKLGVKASETIVFEDSFHGVEASRRAGMKVVGVATTHEKSALTMADFQINDFTEINLSQLQEIVKKD